MVAMTYAAAHIRMKAANKTIITLMVRSEYVRRIE